LIARLERGTDPVDALVLLADLALYAAVEAMGVAFDETPAAYVAGAARRFANQASDEDWLAVTAALERAAAPGSAALVQMVRWALARDEAELTVEPTHDVAGGCGCGGRHAADHPAR
jgi:hypothetical protein